MLQPLPALLHTLPEAATRNEEWYYEYGLGTGLTSAVCLLAIVPLPALIPRWTMVFPAAPAVIYLFGYLYEVLDATLESADTLPIFRGADHEQRLRHGITYFTTVCLYSPPLMLYAISLLVAGGIIGATNVFAVLVVAAPLLILAVPLVVLPLYLLPIALPHAAHTGTATSALRLHTIFSIATSHPYIETALAILGFVLVSALLGIPVLIIPVIGVPLTLMVAFGLLVALHVSFANGFLKHTTDDGALDV